jgi:uncharacterized membrane protein YjgN (DUF898 family)
MSFNPLGNVGYAGQSAPLFKLAFVTGLLSVVTVGIYRFWAKTRLRKYIWSSTSVDGDAFEYTGTGLEKLLGFLIAIVFLAVYLGIIQLLLTFVGLGLTARPGNELALIASFYLSFFAVAPFLLFAVYRSRRYKMARTRLRGIRFGMDSAAWAYAVRAIGHYFLTLISFGVLLPRQTFYLEKFMTDRTFYGDARFEQGGRWQALYAAMKHIFIGIGAVVVGGILAFAFSPVAGGIVAVVGYFWVFIGFVYYRVKSFAYLTNTKTLGGHVTFTANPSTGKIIKVVILGGFAVAIVAGIALAVLGGLFAAIIAGGGMDASPSIAVMIPVAIAYLFVIVAIGALMLVMIVQPLIEHVVGTLHINNVEALAVIRQRAYDAGADADGFADALDVGGAL